MIKQDFILQSRSRVRLQELRARFQRYFKEVSSIYREGNYTEMTFRTPLAIFIEGLYQDSKLREEAGRTTGVGIPDFSAHRRAIKVGYLETKEPRTNLNDELDSEQIEKYKESIDNIVLTNYSRFILLRKGEMRSDLSLFSLSDLSSAKFALTEDKIQAFLQLINTFFDYNLPILTSPEELASELSKKAKLLRELAKAQLREDLSRVGGAQPLSSVYDFFQSIKQLMTDIDIDKCADAYSQTIAYGLFLAGLNAKQPLERDTASLNIPQSIAIIRKIFGSISGDLPPNLSWIIEEIIEILNAADMRRVLSQLDERSRKDRDPFIFFYENFLAQYDPTQRKMLGVFYTPRPIINFIVKSLELILQYDFGKLNGFSEDDVTVLDPAAGTGSFLVLTYLRTLVELKDRGLSGLMNTKIADHILRDFYGFEVQITPYILAHLKLAMTLEQWHYKLRDTDRAQVYLTNTLEPSETHDLIPFMRELNEESKVANDVKQRKKILVVLSNPPYRGMSVNKSKWIQSLLKEGYTTPDGHTDKGYYQVDGKPLREANPKWLQDDYVKFIRFAQWKIDMAGEGVMGFITNHSYFDNPTFRGMRKSLIESFNRIYLLDLHGNVRKKERKSPEGIDDENVFDIEQGVAIAILVKSKKFNDTRVFYHDRWGKRFEKYSWLDRNNVHSVKWQELRPESPHYLFLPQDLSLQREYERYWKITDIFPISSIGIITARDGLTIRWTPDAVEATISRFAKMDPEVARAEFNLGKDARDWKVHLAQKDLIESGLDKRRIVPILYRPFDVRYTYYTGRSRGFHCMPRNEVMHNMLHENLGLITRRQMLPPCNYTFVANMPISDGVIRSDNKGSESLFPLYLYSETDSKKPNVSNQVFELLKGLYNLNVSSEEIFCYVYAVLSSEKYRANYSNFLQRDFPRVPFVTEYSRFAMLSQLGKELIDLQLRKVKLPTNTKFEIQGSNAVEFVKYRDGRVYINDEQFFDGVPENVWSHYIGAYQVLDKWLKGRKGKQLGTGEIEHFLQVVEIIKRTIQLMKKLDETNFLAIIEKEPHGAMP